MCHFLVQGPSVWWEYCQLVGQEVQSTLHNIACMKIVKSYLLFSHAECASAPLSPCGPSQSKHKKKRALSCGVVKGRVTLQITGCQMSALPLKRRKQHSGALYCVRVQHKKLHIIKLYLFSLAVNPLTASVTKPKSIAYSFLYCWNGWWMQHFFFF